MTRRHPQTIVLAASALTIAFALAPAGAVMQADPPTQAEPAIEATPANDAAPATDAAPAGGPLSDAERAELVATLERGRAETDELLARAEGDLFTTRPEPERWSVAEVLEHIGATEVAMLAMLQQSLAGEPDAEAAQISAAVPVAEFGARIVDRSQRFQAPPEVQPQGGKSREELVATYVEAREATLAFVQGTDAPVASYTVATPAGKLTGHHVLALIAGHNLRHNQQIAEALEQLAAAAATASAQ